MILVLCERHPGKKDCLFKFPKFYVREGKGKMRLRKFYTEDNNWVEERNLSTTPTFHSTRLKPLPDVSCRTSLLFTRVKEANESLPNGKYRGMQNIGHSKKNKTWKVGHIAFQRCARPLLFIWPSFPLALSVSRWACVPPRYGSGYAQTSQRKPIIRTHPLSEKGSDYMGLVREAGLEPARPY